MLLPLHGRKNVLLHGLPGSGKTTLVERLVARIPGPKKGFYTREVRERGRRIGFKIVTLEGQEAWLAKRGKGFPQVGKYRVYVDSFERLAVPTIRDIEPGALLVIDEIGKMELFSKPFQQAVRAALDARTPVLATVGYGQLPFIEEIFQREDALFAEVSPESREHLVERILSEFHRPGFLLAIEGLDGAGKSTLIRGLAKALRDQGLRVFATFEPTRGEWGQKIREHLRTGSQISPQALSELFLRDRREHVAKEILPRLAKGFVVICDRYYLSTLAYQGAAGLDISALKRQNETWAPVPDLVLYLDVTPEQGLTRLKEREIFENQAFLQTVSERYAEILPLFRHEKIRADQDPERILEEALERLSPHLEAWKNRA